MHSQKLAGISRTTLEALQERLGYQFRNPNLLQEALTHSSFARESPPGSHDNEQLEFLGDAVLNFVVSVRLADAFPELPEGKLSRARSQLVAANHLAQVGERLELGKFLRLGRGEEKSGGRNKSRLAVNALEAVVAAIYRDGGLRQVQRFVRKYVLPADLSAHADHLFTIDYKSALQEFLQAGRMGAVNYRVVEEHGPEHHKTFVIEAEAQGLSARGSGESKKSAAQHAANNLLAALRRKTAPNG
jgi:ribonuclease-3